MVATYSTMLPLGTEAPSFSLPNVTDGSTVSIDTLPEAKAYVVAFVCNHCPFVKLLQKHFAGFANSSLKRGVEVFAISSNDIENYPDDSPEKMAEELASAGYTCAYLYDETQSVAQAYRAACTPDFFVFDGDQQLVYRGQFDDSRPESEIPVTGSDLRAACDAVLGSQPVAEAQRPSLGCNIKWKPGNEPDYFG